MGLVLNPGNIAVLSARLLFPERGVWLADLQLDADVIALAPSAGKIALTIGAAPGPLVTLVGTVDPRGTGAFSSLYTVRMVGGGGGWDSTVPRQDFQSDAMVLSTVPYSATGAMVGEVVAVQIPRPLGTHFVRIAGPASRVLDREASWWVDPVTGVTTVGLRPPAVADPSLTLIFWDAAAQVATLTCDALVVPGTVIVDPRIGATPVTVRDVEQIFDGHGSHVTAWCGASAVTQLANDLRSMVREFAGVAHLRTYLYRVVVQDPATGRVQLQAVHPDAGAPDTLPMVPWTGVQGATVKYKPGSLVRVAFMEGDPGQPIIDASETASLPLEATYDATLDVKVGPSAALVALAGGAIPVALAPSILTLNTALGVWAAAVATALQSAGFPITAPTSTLAAAIMTAATGTPAKKVIGA